MSKNVSLMGADYPDVPAVVLPQTGGGSAIFTDVSETTASAENVEDGKIFFNASGQRSVGSAKLPYGKHIDAGQTYTFTPSNKPALIAISRAASSRKGLAIVDYWGSVQELVAFEGATISASGGSVTIANSSGTSGAISMMVIPVNTYEL